MCACSHIPMIEFINYRLSSIKCIFAEDYFSPN